MTALLAKLQRRMRSKAAVAAVLTALAGGFASNAALRAQQGAATPIPTDAPLRVSSDIRIERGVHQRTPREIESGGPKAVMFLSGARNVVVDLRGATLVGAPDSTPQDRLEGFALHLADCEGVTVRGGTLRGFKAGIVAERCKGVRIEQVRFERNFAQRLASTAAAEDPGDWLNPHDNDAGEWLSRYGAAISMSDCEGAVVEGCRARTGQNGLLLTRSRNAKVYDNDFSFLSGWGVALYRSSDNVIARNRCDYCVRGYSHEVYWRGQDSAGILLFERSCDNVIAENSARCSGDGLFVFAGRDLVDGKAAQRGELAPGGCDRNLVYRNDFSAAVANGVEITFSRENRVIENVADDCLQHGLWGGYSSRMVIAENSFSGARDGGVTIEHGQECWIARNVFERCGAGLELYWDEDPQFVGGPFGRTQDTASRDHWIWGNAFADNSADLRIRATTGLRFSGNVFSPQSATLFSPDLALAPGEPSGVEPRELLRGVAELLPSGAMVETTLRKAPTEPPADFVERESVGDLELPGVNRPAKLGAEGARGVESIQMGEWGPWDFESGAPRPAQRPVGGLFAGREWNVAWFSWKDGVDPRGLGAPAWAQAVNEQAALRETVDALVDPWAGRDDVRAAVGETHMGLTATTRIRVEAGRYLLRVTSDDGVRVRVDGARAIDNWTWHAATIDEALLELAAGEHEVAVDYFQIDGGAALSLDLIAR